MDVGTWASIRGVLRKLHKIHRIVIDSLHMRFLIIQYNMSRLSLLFITIISILSHLATPFIPSGMTKRQHLALPSSAGPVERMIVPFLPPVDNNNDEKGWSSPRSKVDAYMPANSRPERKTLLFLGGYIVSSYPRYFYKELVERIGESTGRPVVCVSYDDILGGGGGGGFGDHR